MSLYADSCFIATILAEPKTGLTSFVNCVTNNSIKYAYFQLYFVRQW